MVMLQTTERQAFHKVSLPRMNRELLDSNECKAAEQ